MYFLMWSFTVFV